MSQNVSPPGRHVSPATFITLSFLTAAFLYGPFAADPAPAAAPHPRVICSGAVQHPLAIHVDALDPIRRGAVVRLRVATGTARGFERGQVRLTSSGGATVAGAPRAELRAVPAGGQATSEFRVQVPAQGRRFLIQFRVETEGEDGLSARGAAYNLLPDGPSEQAHEVTSATGVKLHEVAARRIER